MGNPATFLVAEPGPRAHFRCNDGRLWPHRWAAFWRAPRPTLHLVEHFTRVDAETIDYKFTVTDPTMFTQSWTAAAPMSGDQEAMGATVGQLFEYACHEGNYAMENVLRGARFDEQTP